MAYPISNDVLNLFKSQYRQTIRVSVAGQSKSIELSETDIVQQGFSLSRYCVSGSTLEIGSAIASEVDITLNNKDGRFSGFSFEGAELFVEIGIKKWDARKWEKAVMHYVPLGYFTVDNSPRKSQTISIVALDRMMQFARKVDRSQLLFPMTVATLVRTICTKCGITLATDVDILPNSDYIITKCPDEENLTYRQLLQWAAMMTATCAYMDWEGKLRLEWYKSSNPTKLTPGDRYVPSDLSEKAITITGVELVTEDEQTFICGEEGYTLVIEANKLIQHSFEEVLLNIYAIVGNFTYRPFSCNTKPHPHLFPMDKIEWVDAEGHTISTILTTYSFALNCSTALAAKGETEVEAGYASGNPLTAQEKTIIHQMKNETNTEMTNRQQAVLQLNETVVNSLGLYETNLLYNDGSVVFYYHNKPTLSASTTIYTHKDGGFAWTSGENCWNDGQPTWQYGYSKEGNAVYNALSAYKIETDLLAAGCVTAEKLSVEYKQSVTKEIGDKAAELTQVFTAADGVLNSAISQTNGNVEALSGRISTAETQISQNTESIKLKATQADVDSLSGRVNTAEGSIQVHANKIGLLVETTEDGDKIKSASIVTAINADGSQIKISADRVDIEGKVTAEYVNALGITAKSIEIKNSGGNVLFKASGNSVRIANFIVGTNAIHSDTFNAWTTGTTAYEGLYFGEDGIQFINDGIDENKVAQPCRFWIDKSGTMCIEKGSPGSGKYLSFDFDGLHIHNGKSLTDDDFSDIGIQPGFIQIYTKSKSSGGGMSVIPMRFDAYNGNYYLQGNWYLNDSEIATTSWRGAKRNIETLSDKYSVLFDHLKPSRFIYEEGASGRYHTGFILDELRDAIDAANLDTDEVAAYCVIDGDTGRGGIRYGEIVPLCVNEIQKLKTRISELEIQLSGKNSNGG